MNPVPAVGFNLQVFERQLGAISTRLITLEQAVSTVQAQVIHTWEHVERIIKFLQAMEQTEPVEPAAPPVPESPPK